MRPPSRLAPRSSALLALVCACSLSSGCYRTAQWWLDLPPFRHDAGEEIEMMVPMRDGIKLATDVYLPGSAVGSPPFGGQSGVGNRESAGGIQETGTKGGQAWPTLLVRTPYSKSGVPMFMEVVGRFFARYGYAVVIQDVRGRYRSEGKWYPVLHELEDGADTARWVLAQPWCNGSLGLLGASYLTVTAWLVADQVPDAVKTMVLAVGSLDPYIVAYQRGMIRSDVVGSWILAMHTPELTVFDVRRHFDAFTRHWPASEADDTTVGNVPFHDDFLHHPARDEFWLRHPVGVASRARMPVLMLTGWYDFWLVCILGTWGYEGSGRLEQL
ncbi:MAG: CocE/NonD family hydrolase [Nitrospirae bacterium]|nr:CocE/NonD family hydrolase [Nitrospirota bacterium]